MVLILTPEEGQERRIRTAGSLFSEVLQDPTDGDGSRRSLHRLLNGPQGLNVPRYSDERDRIPPQTIRQCGLSIRPQTRNGKVDLLKQMARTVGASSSEIKEALEALAEPHRIYATPQERENDEIQVLTKVFVDKIRDQFKSSP